MSLRSITIALLGLASAGCGATNPQPSGASDLAIAAGADASPLPGVDLATSPADLSGGDSAAGPNSVGPGGGTVDRLLFAFHGDTRGAVCDDATQYPKDIIGGIYQREAAQGVQFAIDLGDHMNACGTLQQAQTEMALYMAAAQTLGKITFMTAGNHECSLNGRCDGTDPNMQAFLAALQPISPTPYYTFDVTTSSGLATFVVVSDNTWDNTQAAWLDATLTKADAAAKYTFVMRHHPIYYTKLSTPAEWTIISAHKYSLFLASHTHQYLRDTVDDPSGRSVLLGCGGAPLAANQTYYGFGTVKQEADDRLTVSIYDQATGNIQDSWSVTPK